MRLLLAALAVLACSLPASAERIEVLAMGSNDFARPRLAGRCLAVAIGNARAHGRRPVVVLPNAGNSRIAPAATTVARMAARLGAEAIAPQGWARDRVHPSAMAYRSIARAYDGAVVRGDSFAVGIIARQVHRDHSSWGRVGVSSRVVVARIARMDGAAIGC